LYLTPTKGVKAAAKYKRDLHVGSDSTADKSAGFMAGMVTEGGKEERRIDSSIVTAASALAEDAGGVLYVDEMLAGKTWKIDLYNDSFCMS
jgi:hypothetical protein